jgi:hypothetical protein
MLEQPNVSSDCTDVLSEPYLGDLRSFQEAGRLRRRQVGRPESCNDDRGDQADPVLVRGGTAAGSSTDEFGVVLPGRVRYVVL